MEFENETKNELKNDYFCRSIGMVQFLKNDHFSSCLKITTVNNPNEEAISWSSKKQSLITLSTAESEYVTATYTTKEALWLQQIFAKVFQPLEKPITLYSDSQSAIALTKDGSYHAWTKHIDIQYHFIHFKVQINLLIYVVYCSTDMTADILTKALPNIEAKHFSQSFGLLPTWGGVLDFKLDLRMYVSVSQRGGERQNKMTH